MRYLLPVLMLLATLTTRAQRFAVGAEGGFYALTTDYKGTTGIDHATCLTAGITTSYYYSERIAINSGFTSGRFEIWNEGRYYRIPLSVSYSVSRRGMLNTGDIRNRSLLYLLTLGWIPQTLEFEGGLSLAFYDGTYTNEKTYTAYSTVEGQPLVQASPFKLAQQNVRFVPSIDLGFKWSYDINHVHFSLHPRFSYLVVQDNLVRIEDLTTKQVSNGGTHVGFGLSAGLSYSF